jgi:hypothetical protein
VGISTNEISGAPSSAVGTASVTFNIGLGIQNLLRAPLATRSAAARYTSSVPLPERAVDGPHEVAAIMSRLRGASRTERAALSTRRTSSLGTTFGSTTAFWAQNAAIGASSGTFAQVPATLQNVSSYGYIWIDNTLMLSASTIQQIGADFDNAYLSDTAHFGTPSYTVSAPGFAAGPYTACDATGAPTGTSVPAYITPTGGKINVFVINPSSLGSGVGGYFSQLNYVPQVAINCLIGGSSGYTASSVPHSNEAPMIYVAYNSAHSVTFETQEDLVRGTAHEFQHLINFVNHAILNGGSVEDSWINEGMSMLAQDFAVDQLFHTGHDFDDAGSRAIVYLAAPQNFSLTAFTGIDPQKTTQQFNCGSGCYGSEYLFQRYLYDRFGGDAYLKKMLGSSASYANLQQATGIDPHVAISDFAIALAASGTSATTDPRFGFTSLNLLASYPDQFGVTGSIGGPVPAAALAGQTTNSYMLGSFVYYNAGLISQGVTITAKDPTGLFGLQAGVVQR